jgi:phosphoserine aminotransferase
MTGRSDFRPDADYVHICYNDTVYGTKFNYIPDTGNISIVADMSSSILSEPIDVTKFALIYAGAQHNLSIAGLTVVIAREDIVSGSASDIPAVLDYKRLAEGSSKVSTPPCYNVYLAKLTLEWLLENGGLEEMKRRNERKASLIYDYIDGQTYYTSHVDKNCRSMTNIVFTTSKHALDTRFIEEARENGLVNLEGDPSIGGMRASIYNAMPYDGVAKLVMFMKRFAIENPKLIDF